MRALVKPSHWAKKNTPRKKKIRKEDAVCRQRGGRARSFHLYKLLVHNYPGRTGSSVQSGTYDICHTGKARVLLEELFQDSRYVKEFWSISLRRSSGCILWHMVHSYQVQLQRCKGSRLMTLALLVSVVFWLGFKLPGYRTQCSEFRLRRHVHLMDFVGQLQETKLSV